MDEQLKYCSKNCANLVYRNFLRLSYLGTKFKFDNKNYKFWKFEKKVDVNNVNKDGLYVSFQ